MNEPSAPPRGGNGKAIVIGVLATLLGAGLWAVVTVLTEHEFSLVAIGVGALVGLAMFSARPTSAGVAVVAALLTVIGCALGEFLAIPAYVAHKSDLAFSRLISLELHHPKLYFDSLDGKTYLLWGIGAVAAFSMVFRRIQAARSSYGAAPQPYPASQQSGEPQQPYPPYGQQQYGQPQPYGQGEHPGRPYPPR
ncbi:hypothetical protein [Actinomadura sp. DC4]|uniref:hypothetical protein n=1 Tax=Actinomadura sp. DC4 TaxID=3055069 RepID=UPI0025B0B6BC|nr:hypothetical protein [Actinomadura sp. DC4]MDN3355414.1 hypothetical protein [Actinomadura sp. DC4]